MNDLVEIRAEPPTISPAFDELYQAKLSKEV
jgi:hypothetical protein